MYSFSQRTDVARVADEPLYASYLSLTGFDRPYKEDVMKLQSKDAEEVLNGLRNTENAGGKLVFAKQMTKHKISAFHSSLFAPTLKDKHFILIRDPSSVIKSFGKVLPPSLQETGFPAALEIYSSLLALGQTPIVILSEDLVSRPEETLNLLCQALEIPFEASMLSWPAGPKEFDGPWASYFYSATHKSTGFQSQPKHSTEEELLPESMKPLLELAWPIWDLLRSKALRPSPKSEALKPDLGTHSFVTDPRNPEILVGIRDGVRGEFELVPRSLAKVSVLESGFVSGDGVWEGIRLRSGVLLFLDKHLDRLFQGARAIDMTNLGITKSELKALLYTTIDANGMKSASDVHIRLMVTRGLKATPYQSPRATIGLATIVAVPEFKKVSADPSHGIVVKTCHVRRGPPDIQDPALNSHSKLNCILACIQAHKMGADEALMLDTRGFVATCNSVNFGIVRGGEVWFPQEGALMPGITRGNVIRVCKEAGIPVVEKDVSLWQVHSADEAFVTGTFAGVGAVAEVDGRVMGLGEPYEGKRGPVTERLQQLYYELAEREVAKGR